MGKRIKSGQIQEEEEKKTNEASVIPGWVCSLTNPQCLKSRHLSHLSHRRHGPPLHWHVVV